MQKLLFEKVYTWYLFMIYILYEMSNLHKRAGIRTSKPRSG